MADSIDLSQILNSPTFQNLVNSAQDVGIPTSSPQDNFPGGGQVNANANLAPQVDPSQMQTMNSTSPVYSSQSASLMAVPSPAAPAPTTYPNAMPVPSTAQNLLPSGDNSQINAANSNNPFLMPNDAANYGIDAPGINSATVQAARDVGIPQPQPPIDGAIPAGIDTSYNGYTNPGQTLDPGTSPTPSIDGAIATGNDTSYIGNPQNSPPTQSTSDSAVSGSNNDSYYGPLMGYNQDLSTPDNQINSGVLSQIAQNDANSQPNNQADQNSTAPAAAGNTPGAKTAGGSAPGAKTAGAKTAGANTPATTQGANNSVWQNIVQTESGGNPNAKNPNSSASGIGQVTNGLYQDFLNSPNGKGYTLQDKNNPDVQKKVFDFQQDRFSNLMNDTVGRAPTDAEKYAAWHYGDTAALAMSQNPDTPISKILTPDVFKANPSLDPNMTAANLMVDNMSLYSSGGKFTPGASASTKTANAVPDGTSQASRLSLAQNAMNDPQSVQQAYMPFGVPHSTLGDNLIAIGTGLMGAPNFGVGMSRAGANIQALKKDDNNYIMQGNQAAAQGYRMAQMMGLKQQALDNQTAKTAYQTDPVKQAQAKASIAGATQSVKDFNADQKAASNYPDQVSNLKNDYITMQKMGDAGAQGPTMAAMARRWGANLGLTNDQVDNTVQIALQNKYTAAMALRALTNMVTDGVGGRLTKGEINQAFATMPSSATPQMAGQFILATTKNSVERNQAWAQQAYNNKMANPNYLANGNYDADGQKFKSDWAISHPQPTYQDFVKNKANYDKMMGVTPSGQQVSQQAPQQAPAYVPGQTYNITSGNAGGSFTIQRKGN